MANRKPDPYKISLIVISAVFSLFTFAMLVSQIRLIIINSTTVESMDRAHLRAVEGRVLTLAWPWYQLRQRHELKRRWDAEWGRLEKEGNTWWLGSARANWEARMGSNVWAWLLPIGKVEGVGLSCPINPRLVSGRWQRRSTWHELPLSSLPVPQT